MSVDSSGLAHPPVLTLMYASRTRRASLASLQQVGHERSGALRQQQPMPAYLPNDACGRRLETAAEVVRLARAIGRVRSTDREARV